MSATPFTRNSMPRMACQPSPSQIKGTMTRSIECRLWYVVSLFIYLLLTDAFVYRKRTRRSPPSFTTDGMPVLAPDPLHYPATETDHKKRCSTSFGPYCMSFSSSFLIILLLIILALSAHFATIQAISTLHASSSTAAQALSTSHPRLLPLPPGVVQTTTSDGWHQEAGAEMRRPTNPTAQAQTAQTTCVVCASVRFFRFFCFF